MSGKEADRKLTRRDFLRAVVATATAAASGSLLAACAPAAAPAATPTKPAVAPGVTVAPGATVAPAQVTTEPLKLGVLLPYSGVYTALGESITNAMVLYFDSVNNEAGGRKIQLIKEDEENPEAGLRKARKLIEQDKIDLLTGVVNTAILYAIRDTVVNSKTIYVDSNAGGNDVTRKRKSPYIFRTSFSSWQVSFPMGEWVYKNVGKDVFVTAADYAFGHESIDAFEQSFLKLGGKIAGKAYPPLGNTDYAAYLTQIANAKPAATYNFYSGSDAVNFVKQYGEYGLNKTVKLTSAGFMVEQDVLPAQGKAALGAVSGLHWALTLDNPENRRFTAEYKKRFGKDANVFAVQGYDTAQVIVEAVNKVGGKTADKEKLIATIAGIQLNSPRGPFKFDPDTHNVIQNIYVREVKEANGQLTNVVIHTFPEVRDPGQ